MNKTRKLPEWAARCRCHRITNKRQMARFGMCAACVKDGIAAGILVADDPYYIAMTTPPPRNKAQRALI